MREYEPVGYCRTCGARDGELCITPSGRLASHAHATRTRGRPSADTLRRGRRPSISPVVRREVLHRSGGWCEGCPLIDHRAPRHVGEHMHHRLRRSQGGKDTAANVLWVCVRAHALIHDNPEESYELGLMLRSTSGARRSY